jgi:putative transposase
MGCTTQESDWGFGLCCNYLHNVEGFQWHHKRVYRIYCERWLKRHQSESLKEPVKSHQVWSIEVMHDQFSDGRSYRLFKDIDDYRREGLAVTEGHLGSESTAVMVEKTGHHYSL